MILSPWLYSMQLFSADNTIDFNSINTKKKPTQK